MDNPVSADQPPSFDSSDDSLFWTLKHQAFIRRCNEDGVPDDWGPFLAPLGSPQRIRHLLDLCKSALEISRRTAAARGESPSASTGGSAFAEFYGRKFPELTSDAAAFIELIRHEFELRGGRQHEGLFDELLGRFPALAQGLRKALAWPDIPGHQVVGDLGRGGMGVVYKARDLNLNRIVAVKTLVAGHQATPDQRERFRSEAHAIARLRHPNIIAIHAIGEQDDRPYLSLEFAEGGSLAQRLTEKPMAPREAAELVETLARAVHAAHQAGVVHRDLKPGNVLLTAESVPKISDFGLAKLLDSDSSGTLSGQPIGTPSYMAPEQAEGHSRQVGPAADIYALGAILYRALTGRPPFLGESTMETLKLVTSTEAVPPRRLRPGLSRDLETIALKCLEKDPSRRVPVGPRARRRSQPVPRRKANRGPPDQRAGEGLEVGPAESSAGLALLIHPGGDPGLHPFAIAIRREPRSIPQGRE